MNRDIQSIILRELEGRIEPLNAARGVATVPARGWLRAVREAIGLTQSRVASRAAMKRQSYSQFERSEERGSISIASLSRAAGAMDCELVYFLVPRQGVARTYSDLASAHHPAGRHIEATEHSMALSNRDTDPPGEGVI